MDCRFLCGQLCIVTNQLTDFMLQSPWGARSDSASQ